MQLLSPQHWNDYELIDSGHYAKLERYGNFVLWRPEPQACWDPAMREDEWKKQAHVRFIREAGGAGDTGKWDFLKKMPDRWHISYNNGPLRLKFRLALTAFKHIGLFPEQAVNWDYIFDFLQGMNPAPVKALNLFAYTGGASLAAKAAGAEVVHVDSVKQVVGWARENMEESGLDGIRWMVEDAMKFLRREVRRGSVYQAVILDPPAYGRGPSGEKWILEDGINELVKLSSDVLDKSDGLLLLNLYSMGFSALVAENLGKTFLGNQVTSVCGELFIPDRAGRKLPLGTFMRAVCKK